jgi:hypothetical protein
MAHLLIDAGRVRLELSLWEKLGAFHSSPQVLLSEVVSVAVVANPWTSEVLKGVRIGTGFPYLILLGTMKYIGGKDFCAIYKRRPNALVTLKSGPFKRWIFEIRDLEEIVGLQKALGAR